MKRQQMSSVTLATSENGAGTIVVQATDQGLPVDIRVAKGELRYGARSLAEQILRLTRLAATEAGVRRRDELAEAGVPDTMLDRLGLPTRDDLDALAPEPAATPFTWLRQA